MEGNLPKQYLLLGGLPILVHTLRVFQQTDLVDEIFLVLPAADLEKARQEIVERYQLTKVRRILPGGNKRQDSVKNGLEALDARYDIVVVHDGVRPFVSPGLVAAAVKEARRVGAVTVGVPAKDTLKTVDADGFVTATLPREQIWLTQTPQAFQAALLKEAYRRAREDNYYGTDDASLIERMGGKVKMLPGTEENIKITTPNDLTLGTFILQRRSGGCEPSAGKATEGKGA